MLAAVPRRWLLFAGGGELGAVCVADLLGRGQLECPDRQPDSLAAHCGNLDGNTSGSSITRSPLAAYNIASPSPRILVMR